MARFFYDVSVKISWNGEISADTADEAEEKAIDRLISGGDVVDFEVHGDPECAECGESVCAGEENNHVCYGEKQKS